MPITILENKCGKPKSITMNTTFNLFIHSLLIHPFLYSSISCMADVHSDVETLVVLQVPQVGEAFPTLVAHVLFLTGVDLLVGLQAVALVEAASAYVTAERFLTCVDALVSVQVTCVAETFSTRVTAERFLSCVDHLM